MIARRKDEKLLIINADDLGLSTGTNQGIEKAFQKGILTSASLMVTTPAFKDALHIIKKNPKLGIGIHLSLTWGKSILPPDQIPDLVDKEGYFYPSYFRLLLNYTNVFKEQVEKELYAQMEKAVKVGVRPDHLNSQVHVHMIPWIFPIFKKIAKEYRIKFIRFSNEKFFLIPTYPAIFAPFINSNIIKFLLLKTLSKHNHLKSPVRFFGILYTQKMDYGVFGCLLKKVQPGVTEILSHPAEYKITAREKSKFNFLKQDAIQFMKDKNRQIELRTLTKSRIKNLINENNILLTNYRELSNKNTK